MRPLPALPVWIRAHRPVGRWLKIGASSFPFCPNVPARREPAIWLVTEAPSTIVLVPAPRDLGQVEPAKLFEGRKIVTDIHDTAHRYLILSDRLGLHRLLVIEPNSSTGHVYAIVPDSWQENRAAAVARFGRSCERKQPNAHPAGLFPTAYQRHRLELMLKMLDHLAETHQTDRAARSIAQHVIYPRHKLGRAIEWKSSSERRQTQRLLNTARFLAQEGYRELLKGRIGA